MKLTELNPEWQDNPHDGLRYLKFDCPKQHKVWPDDPESKMICQICIPVTAEPHWHVESGEIFDNITIRPSIDHQCQQRTHFYITNGEIEIL